MTESDKAKILNDLNRYNLIKNSDAIEYRDYIRRILHALELYDKGLRASDL